MARFQYGRSPARASSLAQGAQSRSNYGTGRNYVSQASGTRRHELTIGFNQGDIPLGDYVTQVLCRFKRSFDTGDDDPPTPTQSNNYQSTTVFNGSKILDYECKIKIMNQSGGSGTYLDVYLLTASFSDAVWHNTILGSSALYSMQTTPSNEAGDTNFISPHPVFTENFYKGSKTMQRTVKQLGTVFVTSEDGGTPQAEFTLRGLPPQVRRSQTGMFYGLLFHYSGDKNTAVTTDLNMTAEIKFKEQPSDNRLPFNW